MAKYTAAQNKATQKYISNNYDQISIRIPKGKRNHYKEYASSKGLSLNQLIVLLLDKEIEGGITTL